MGVSIRPEGPEDDPLKKRMADEWDRLVASGVSPDEATAQTHQMYQRLSVPSVRPDASPGITREQASAATPAELAAGRLNPDKTTNPLAAILAGITQGGMAQFADEASARIESTVNPSSDHDANLARARSVDARYRKNHPVAYTAGEVIGSLAIPTAAAVRGTTWLAKAGRAAVAGGAMGAASGAGASEGTTRERLPDAATGAGIGAGLGLVIPAIGATGRVVADKIPGMRLATRAARQARPNDPRSIISSIEERADERILRDLERDRIEIPVLEQRASDATAAGKPETLLEFGGHNVKRTGRTVRTVPGEGSDRLDSFLESRGEAAGKRFVDDVYEATGSTKRNVTQTIEDLSKVRSQHADELYGKVYDQTVDEPALAGFFADPAFRRAYDRARRIASREKVAGKATDDMPALDALLDETGNLKQPLTVRQLDRIKRGLDDELDVGARSPLDAGGLGNEEAGSLRTIKNQFLGLIDGHVPEYAAARQVFAGESAMMKAMDMGRKLYDTPYDEMEAIVAKMGPSEREAFQKGGAQAVAARARGTDEGMNIYRRVAGDDIDKDRLRLLFPGDDAAYTTMVDRFKRERDMFRNERFVRGGSQTADKSLDALDLAGGSIDDAAAAVTTGGTSALASFLARAASARARTGMTERVAGALSNRYTTPATNPDAIRTLIDELTEVANRKAKGKTARGTATVGASSYLGGQRER